MSLNQLRQNLNSSQYFFLFEFLQDQYLIWDNCKQYNSMTNDKALVQAADEQESYFVSLL